ncbi:DNA polymerase III subunit gamma/tau [Paraclostridium bifermentans]
MENENKDISRERIVQRNRIYSFSKVIGNVSTVRLLRRGLATRSLKNFIILNGIPGTGKSTCGEIAGLYLTCDNPSDDGEPCGVCKSCASNIRALQTTGVSTNLIKVNLGRRNSKRDIEELIKEIFVLQSPIGNNVYLLEEAHVLNDECQTALLEEIDRLDDNVYVIICTTKAYRLLPELRSRALQYNFTRLNPKESKMLFDMTCERLGLTSNKEVESLIVRKSRGVARDLVTLTDFIASTKPTVEELSNFLGYVSTNDFSDLLEAMSIGTKEMVAQLEYMNGKYTYDVILEQLNVYVSDALFYVSGGIVGPFDRRDTKTIRELLTEAKLYKIMSILEKYSVYNTTEAEFRMLMLKISRVILDKKMSDIVRDNLENASEQKIQAKNTANFREQISRDASKKSNKNLNKMSIEEFSKYE